MLRQGRITSVSVSNGTVRADVNMADSHISDHINIPVASPVGTFVGVPAQGDDVLVAEMENGSHIVTHILTKAPLTFPVLAEDDLCFTFSDGTEFTVAKSGGQYEITINADTTITLGDPDTAPDGAVIDVTTTKDANGKVTSVTPVRSTKTNIE